MSLGRQSGGSFDPAAIVLRGEGQLASSGVPSSPVPALEAVGSDFESSIPTTLDHPAWAHHPRARRTPKARGRAWVTSRLLMTADVVTISVAYLATSLIFARGGNIGWLLGSGAGSLVLLGTLPIWMFLFKFHRLYGRDGEAPDHSTADEMGTIFHSVTLGAFVLLAAEWLLFPSQLWIGATVTFWLIAFPVIALGRVGARSISRKRPSFRQNAVIVGSGIVGQRIARKILNHPEFGIDILGFADTDLREAHEEIGDLRLLCDTDDLPQLVRELGIERVIIAFSTETHDQTLELVRSLSDLEVQVDIVPRLFEVVGSNASHHSIEGVPLLGIAPFRLSRAAQAWKRGFDLAAASLALCALGPLFVAVAIAVKLDSKGPVFFRQVRVGARNAPFRIYKFRTMVLDAEEKKADVAHLNVHARNGGDPRMFKVVGDPRVTRVGRFLRSTWIDEVPQLFNVLRGEMSIVGPRPLILSEDQHVKRWQRHRLDLKPGMTGLWQALGSSKIPFDEMVKLDYLYVTGWTPLADLKLVFRTVAVVFRRGGS